MSSPVNADATLVVPMCLDALMVTSSDPSIFDLWQMNYKRLNNFQNPMSPPFNDHLGSMSSGVCLHWILPSALARRTPVAPSAPGGGTPDGRAATRADANDTGLEYPFAP